MDKNFLKHIILVTTSYPDINPGSEAAGSFVEDFAKELSLHAKVTIIAPSLNDSEEHNNNIRIIRFAVPRLPLSLLRPARPSHWLPILKTLVKGNQATLKQASTEKVDFILALWALPSGYWARSVSKQYDIPYGIWALGSDIWSLGKIPIIKSILKSVLKKSAALYADGILLSKEVENISQNKCAFLPSTRDLCIKDKKQMADSPPYRLAYLGRWHTNKGVDILVDSLNHLNNEDWEKITEVRIAGGGPLAALIESSCKKLQNKKRSVTTLGYLDKNAAKELLLWADYLLIPSRIESIPVVFSDAMQTQTAIIAMPVGDLPRLMKSLDVGIQASTVSSQSFCSAIQEALNTPPTKFHVGFEIACEKFSLSKIVTNLLADIEDIPPQIKT